jgi:hypothetical protein
MWMVVLLSKTKEQIFYERLKSDRAFYIENFLKIRNKSAQLIPFKLNHAQKIVVDLIRKCEEEGRLKRFIVLKARQMGLSTFFEGEIFRATVTNSLTNSLIVAHQDSSTQALFNMSKLFFDELPDVLKPMKKYSNGKELVFENPTTDDNVKQENPGLRSKITVATAGAGEVARGMTIHNFHGSEVAFWPDAKTTMLGLMQAIPDTPNTFVAWESTANGVGDFFHEMWQKAVRGENEFIPVFLPWFIDPGYTRPFRSDAEREQLLDEISGITTDSQGNPIRTYDYELMQKFNLTLEQLNWRRYTVANKCQGDEILFMQEYPSTPEEAFISSGRPKFSIKALKKYQTITKEPIARGYLFDKGGRVEFVEDKQGYISIWKKPESGTSYAIGADVAEGLIQGDYSCAVVGNSEFDIVATWHGHIDPDLFGTELVKLSRYYNDAYLGVENNNHGLTTLSQIKKLEYWNLFFTKSYDKIADTQTQKLGWTTSSRTKPFMIDKLAEFVREHYLGIFSDQIISEMYTYVIGDDGKTNAQSGCFDDSVMATAIMLQLLLEGKGEHYVPEIPIESRGKGARDIVDPSFEADKNVDEVAD